MNNNETVIPRQKLAFSQKTKEWKEQCMDAIEKLCYTQGTTYRPSVYKKKINYDLFNGKFHLEDLEYVCKPLGSAGDTMSFPASLQHYDIISPDLLLLIGEESKRPFNFRIVSTGGDSMSEVEKTKKEMLLKYLQYELTKNIAPEEVQGEQPPMPPPEIQKYMNYTYKDVREIMAQETLDYLYKECDLEMIFNKGWKDALITGEEIYWVGIVNGEPVVELCNPLNVFYIMDTDADCLDEAEAIVQEKWMTPGSIIDQFYEELTPSQIDQLEELGGLNSKPNSGARVNYQQPLPLRITSTDAQGSPVGIGNNQNYQSNGNIRVIRCEWRSRRKIGFLTYQDEEGNEQEEMVDEAYKPMKELGETVRWEWINEYWEGTKIAGDIYINIRPKPNQRRKMDNISSCKSGFTGVVYNNRNSDAVSLVDRMKPYQYLYNIIYYRMELALAKSKGKVFIMDITQIPSDNGWDVAKWMHYLEAMNIAFINPHEEGPNGAKSNFNQFQAIDLEMGQFIQQQVTLLDKIEQKVSELSGVSRQRKGQVQSSELVGNTERAVVQSSHITEYWFTNHNSAKKRVIEGLIEVAKIAWREGKKVQYITSDLSRVFLNIDGETFENSEYGIFVSNSSKDELLLQSLRNLAQSALQADKASLSDIVSIMESNSIAQVKRDLLESEERRAQQGQASEQAQQKHEQDLFDKQMQMEQFKQEQENERNKANNETKIHVAEISSFIGQMDQDSDGDNVPDQLEIEKLRVAAQKNAVDAGLKQQELATHASLESKRMAHEKEMQDKDLKVKLEDIKAKKIIAKSRPKPTKK